MPEENNNIGINVPLATDTISSDTLASQTDFAITPATPSTATKGALAAFEAGASQFTENLNQEREEAREARDSGLESYIQGLSDTESEAGATNRLFSKKGGVDDIGKELGDINQQILQEQNSLRRRLEAMEKNPQGLFGGGLEAEMERVERESLKKQADLSIIQMGIQGRYDSAKAISDRAVSALMEDQRNRNEALRVNYEANKDLFDTADQRAFETAQNARERELDREEKRLQEISDLSLNALENGAPTSVVTAMRTAETLEDAIRIGGSFIGLYDRAIKQLQIANTQSQIDERNAKTTDGEPLTSTQYVALGYANRLMEADVIIDEIGGQFTGATSALAGYLPNFLKTSDRQRYEQAQRNFINAVLRKESGAAISPTEFASAAEQYFPQPGDSADVVIQKNQNRATVTANLLREAGQDTSIQDATLADPLSVGVNPTADNPLGI